MGGTISLIGNVAGHVQDGGFAVRLGRGGEGDPLARAGKGTATSAAIIMVAVFGIFGTLKLIMMKQLGVGLGVAVLIDATIIRGVLLPAAMKVLGEWNWWLPRALGRRLPAASH